MFSCQRQACQLWQWLDRIWRNPVVCIKRSPQGCIDLLTRLKRRLRLACRSALERPRDASQIRTCKADYPSATVTSSGSSTRQISCGAMLTRKPRRPPLM